MGSVLFTLALYKIIFVSSPKLTWPPLWRAPNPDLCLGLNALEEEHHKRLCCATIVLQRHSTSSLASKAAKLFRFTFEACFVVIIYSHWEYDILQMISIFILKLYF